jgi:hypothetical protein
MYLSDWMIARWRWRRAMLLLLLLLLLLLRCHGRMLHLKMTWNGGFDVGWRVLLVVGRRLPLDVSCAMLWYIDDVA